MMPLQSELKFFLKLISASKFIKDYNRLLPDETALQIQRDAWGSMHITQVAQQFLQANCLQMIDKEQLPT